MTLNRFLGFILISTFCIAVVPGKLSGWEPSSPMSANDSLQLQQTHSFKSDLLKSALGSAIGGIVGAGMGGVIPIWFDGDYGSRAFPDNSFYLSSYVGAGLLAALSSATALYLSKDRNISWWGLASYSLLPPMILVLPLSVYASIHDREELVRATWVATLASIGVSTVWNVLVYRVHHPRKNNDIAIRFGEPYLSATHELYLNSRLRFGIKIIEVHF